MKKILLTLTLILSVSFSFANSNAESKTQLNADFGTCKYSITKTIYYPDGTIERETKTYTSYAVNRTDCENQAKAKLTMLKDGAPF